MIQNEREITLAGAEYQDSLTDMGWVRRQPSGNWAIRTLGFVLRKAFRKGCKRISFDKPSFERAMTRVEPDDLVVLAPTHRSMMDFLVISYLCFGHPELKISIPYIAADLQIGNLPFLGWFLKHAYAFYLKRGQGKADPELNQKLRQLATDHQTLEIFIEGTRSRSRQCLAPKRGLLRALQQTGVPCTVLPISINYDRVPEEAALMKELQGGPKPLLRNGALIKWCIELVKGQVQIGRVHMVCGEPVRLGGDSDVHDVSRRVMGQLQENYVVTTFHLRAFLHHHHVPGFDLESLAQAIRERGGTVLESPLEDVSDVSQLTEYTLRFQWLHYFYPDLMALWPQHPIVQHHVMSNSFSDKFTRAGADPRQNEALMALLQTLFQPLSLAYATLLEDARQARLKFSHPKAYVARYPECFLPMIEEALSHLTDANLLVKSTEQNGFEQGPEWKHQIERYRFPLWEQNRVLQAPQRENHPLPKVG